MKRSLSHGLCGAWMAATALAATAPASAEPNAPTIAIESAPAKPGKRSWSIREFTTIRLVRREPGPTPNQHPRAIPLGVLSQQLSMIQFVSGNVAQRLFAADEVAELVEPLSQAIASAGPDDDLTLLSTSRRGEGFLTPPTGVTARLFVQDGALQVLINDVRLDFVNRYRGTNVEPEFVYGTRLNAGSAVVQSAGARNVRPDWLVLPLSAPVGAAPQPIIPQAGPGAAPAAGDDIERRLTTLKRLRDRGLITEEEYQVKRREILQQL